MDIQTQRKIYDRIRDAKDKHLFDMAFLIAQGVGRYHQSKVPGQGFFERNLYPSVSHTWSYVSPKICVVGEIFSPGRSDVLKRSVYVNHLDKLVFSAWDHLHEYEVMEEMIEAYVPGYWESSLKHEYERIDKIKQIRNLKEKVKKNSGIDLSKRFGLD
ncbi:hypothetical protein COV93_07365 [Candidatus Woesearchaeota archaeon CG11_big_fil_rev_8_21_14_0_20_43_8]|nr:MAG: hypothetical protein COV93_07365 [Candidatus Woesearchaeota archaeon CG11_big_fil_rev_8_21_14_0_20_43_8]PIO08828.1 MAG: hypothetical protein COT47_00980 [Candidatus Woesearchaeota archaeon CG08_land_8_20_14_0_20_43_7]